MAIKIPAYVPLFACPLTDMDIPSLSSRCDLSLVVGSICNPQIH